MSATVARQDGKMHAPPGAAVAHSMPYRDLVSSITARELVPDIPSETIMTIGANLRHDFPASAVPAIMESWMTGIQLAFIPPVAHGIFALAPTLLLEWRDVRDLKVAVAS
jgi:hypothetical protein